MNLKTIILVNDANDPRVTQAQLEQIADVANCYVNDYLQKFYGFNAFVSAQASGAKANAWLCHLVKALDDPNAIAYHTRNAQGNPELYQGLDVVFNNGGTVLDGALSVSVGILHEIAETLNDPWCTYWSDTGDTRGEVADEIVDPVEGDTFLIKGVTVPNFILPDWFDQNAGTGIQLDYSGNLKAPLTLHENGYAVFRNGPESDYQTVFGARVPEWRRKHLTKYGRRVRADVFDTTSSGPIITL